MYTAHRYARDLVVGTAAVAVCVGLGALALEHVVEEAAADAVAQAHAEARRAERAAARAQERVDQVKKTAALAGRYLTLVLQQLPAARAPVEPALGPAHVDSFSVACGTTATEISAPSGKQYAYTCTNETTTEVAVGDADLAAPASNDSPIYCDGCVAGASWDAHAYREYCRVDAGTVTVTCRSLVGAAPSYSVSGLGGGSIGSGGGVSYTTLDGRYVNVDGDTMTGTLSMAGEKIYFDSTTFIQSLATNQLTYSAANTSNGDHRFLVGRGFQIIGQTGTSFVQMNVSDGLQIRDTAGTTTYFHVDPSASLTEISSATLIDHNADSVALTVEKPPTCTPGSYPFQVRDDSAGTVRSAIDCDGSWAVGSFDLGDITVTGGLTPATAANQACDTTCGISGCAVAEDTDTSSWVLCSDASADRCQCWGPTS